MNYTNEQITVGKTFTNGSFPVEMPSHADYLVMVIRYPTDAYDRIWAPVSFTGGQFTTLAYDGFLIDTSTSPEDPPQDVLENALTTLSTSDQTLNWTLSFLPSTPISVYLILYFSEMTGLTSTQKRAFSVYIDNTLMNSTRGLVPPYGGVSELTVYNISMSKTTAISLVPTTDSTEPPLVNAMEVFQISDYKVSYTAAASSSPSPPDSSSGDTPPSSSGDNTPPASFSGNDTPPISGDGSGSSSGKSKSKLPVILGAGLPVFILFSAFLAVVVLMHQKRKQAAMMGAGELIHHHLYIPVLISSIVMFISKLSFNPLCSGDFSSSSFYSLFHNNKK